jgi:hypothetical protein
MSEIIERPQDTEALQCQLDKLEKWADAWEQKAKDREVSIREFRSCFAKYGGKKNWRERFEKIEIAINSNENAAAEYRDLAKQARCDAEEVKLTLARNKDIISQEAIMQIIRDSALSDSHKKKFTGFVRQGELEKALAYALGYIESMERDKTVLVATTSDTRH